MSRANTAFVSSQLDSGKWDLCREAEVVRVKYRPDNVKVDREAPYGRSSEQGAGSLIKI
jgi:hypothetical protein